MFGLGKKLFIALLIVSESTVSMANDSNFITCISLNNHQCMAQLTLINLNPNQYRQGLHCYPFAGDLDRCSRSCNILDGTSDTFIP